MSDWKDVIATVAPSIATALGGPLAGLAVGAIGDIFGLSDATQEKVAAAIVRAQPADLLLLKKAELDFKARMVELEIDLERISSEDRNIARNREVQVKDRIPALLATLITFGFFGILSYMLTHGIPEKGGEAMLGALGGAFGSVISYYFGSSSTSRAKDVTISKLAT